MAPELVRGETPRPAADLWSLGATLYTAVEGRPPFPHGDPAPTLAAVLLDPPPTTRLAGPLRPLLNWLLAKDPAGRPSRDAIHTLLTAAQPTTPTHTPLPAYRTRTASDPTEAATTRPWPSPTEHTSSIQRLARSYIGEDRPRDP